MCRGEVRARSRRRGRRSEKNKQTRPWRGHHASLSRHITLSEARSRLYQHRFCNQRVMFQHFSRSTRFNNSPLLESQNFTNVHQHFRDLPENPIFTKFEISRLKLIIKTLKQIKN